MRILLLWGLVSLLLQGCDQTNPDTLRNLKQGSATGSDEGTSFNWKGIPFAQPPTGELRWLAPRKASPWQGTLSARNFRKACFQPGGIFGASEQEWLGSEDCLYLNVWSPAFTPEEAKIRKLPVMMWIHGGANVIGSAETYDPSQLVEKHQVIVVTVQYRMSSLGWFRHPAFRQQGTSLADQSGNYGTLDTIMALTWIQENIASFGGNASNVTVFGESAGGHNVIALFASPLASGLFHKVIMQSGIVSVPNLSQSESYYPPSNISGAISSREVINHLLIEDGQAADRETAIAVQNGMSMPEIANYVRSKSPVELLTAERLASPRKAGMTRAFPDGHVIRADGITASFVDSQAVRTPIILGTNRDESKLFNAMSQRLVVWDEAGGLYSFMGRMPLEILRPDYYDAISDYGSGFWKLRAADRPASQLVRSGHTDTFVYRFDWDELPEINNVDYARLIGAAHAMELLFIFGTALDNTLIKQLVVRDSYPEAQTLSDQMQSYWVEFAYTGDPGRGRSGDLPTWQSWSDEPGANKSMILDSTNDQGLMMSPLAYSETLLLDRLAADSRLNPRERCETLFALSWGDGDDLSEAGWNNFSNGECSRLDYSKLIEQLEERSFDNES